jgi:hypothetical protein
MLTPAPDVAAVAWTRLQLRAEEYRYTDVKLGRRQRAIDFDVAEGSPVAQIHRRVTSSQENWLTRAVVERGAPRFFAGSGVLHNQYVSVSVAAPARSRQVPNRLIAASILSIIQPPRIRSLRKNQFGIRIMMVPNLSAAMPYLQAVQWDADPGVQEATPPV